MILFGVLVGSVCCICIPYLLCFCCLLFCAAYTGGLLVVCSVFWFCL